MAHATQARFCSTLKSIVKMAPLPRPISHSVALRHPAVAASASLQKHVASCKRRADLALQIQKKGPLQVAAAGRPDAPRNQHMVLKAKRSPKRQQWCMICAHLACAVLGFDFTEVCRKSLAGGGAPAPRLGAIARPLTQHVYWGNVVMGIIPPCHALPCRAWARAWT